MNVGMDRKQVDRKDVLMLRLFEGKLGRQVRERYVGRLRCKVVKVISGEGCGC